MIRLEPVTPQNWRLPLAVTEEQQAYVASVPVLLARAYAYRDCRSHALVIYAGDTPVGMALYYDCDAFCAYDFSQLLIDRRYQGKGYGTAAATAILQRMAQDGKYDRVVLCYIESNEVARRLYEKLGFVPTGERDEDEIVFEKTLQKERP